MTAHLRIGLVATVAVAWAAPAAAQAGILSGEIGFAQPRAAVAEPQLVLNGAFSFIINGSAERNAAILVPIGFEYRFDFGSTQDIIGSGEVAFRVHNVAFGPGATYGFIFREDLRDAACPLSGAIPGTSGCRVDERGMRDGGVLSGLGLSGYMRVGFGPQSRGFAQGRLIFYRPSLVLLQPGSVFAATWTGVTLPSYPTDFPAFKSGLDVRLAAGWVFGSADRSAKFVKGQLAFRDMQFVHEKANAGGIYDLSRWQLTFGAGVAF
jgi:hypothetical protein